MKTALFLFLSSLFLAGLVTIQSQLAGVIPISNNIANKQLVQDPVDAALTQEKPTVVSPPLAGDNMNNNKLMSPSTVENLSGDLESSQRRPGRPLFTFSGNEPAWMTVNDTVMGGISNSSVQIDPNSQQLSFSGNVSMENNGGFASTRSQWVGYDLRGYDGILMRVLGDGNTYRFRIRTAKTGTEIAYTALFETEADQWQEVFIPFAAMIPTYRGFVVYAAGEIEPGFIRSFGLMVSDKQEGQFSLLVDWINAVAVKRNEYSYAALGEGMDYLPSLVYARN